MDELFELFIKDRRYLKNLSDRTMHFYREVYNFFKGVGFDGSKESLRNTVINFRQRGTSVGAINTYAREMNVFLNWLRTEHGWPALKLERLRPFLGLLMKTST